MKISILTVFSELYTPFLQTSLLKKAVEKGLVIFNVANYFSFVEPKERIDAPTFGHGAGMLIKPAVVEKAIKHQEHQHGQAFRIFFSPQGKKLDQVVLQELAEKIKNRQHLILVSARYEGMDTRVEVTYADEVISLGDFVLMGGDLPAMVLLEGLLRYMPGIVGRAESVHCDSFTGPFVDHPEFTEPVVWRGQEVPTVIRSGNHAAIEQWQQQQAAHKTIREHFEWFKASPMTEVQKKVGFENIPPHYVALLHGEVMVKNQAEYRVGTTSVTSLDLHDIARSARTYGLSHYFIVTPLYAQQKVVERLLTFWQQGIGLAYNAQRYEAVKRVSISDCLNTCIKTIEEKEGRPPILIATSAKQVDDGVRITYYDQAKVWASGRPVLFVLGTGQGLSQTVLKRCDFVLLPLKGFSDFNHLSVRSAAAIIFDRWLGWNQKKISDN
jgi:tRNA (guanine37-N1)-methyltransferase